MPERIRTTRITDARTGEVIQESIETFHASDWFMPGRGYKIYGRARTKLGPWEGISGLSMNERGVLVTLIGLLNKENRLPEVEKMADKIGMKPRQAYRMLNRLQTVGAVAKYNGDYYINPLVAFAGVYLSPMLYRLFKPSLANVVPKWARSAYDNEP